MDPKKVFNDERLGKYRDFCVYCGEKSETRDHVPSKIFLDEPYPPHLPAVGACRKCNASFSQDENYLACFLECVICGSTELKKLEREKINRAIAWDPALRQDIQDSCTNSENGESLLWQPNFERVKNILSKLAKGHVAYELYPPPQAKERIFFKPLSLMNEKQMNAFEDLQSLSNGLWPEAGTRAFYRIVGATKELPDGFARKDGWIEVQRNRYRYAVIQVLEGVIVRMVLRECLAGEVLLG